MATQIRTLHASSPAATSSNGRPLRDSIASYIYLVLAVSWRRYDRHEPVRFGWSMGRGIPKKQ